MNASASPIGKHKAVSMTVHGRVQGVGFRYYTRTHAQRLGVYGWVRNRSDGAVEIWAEGTEDRLHSFIGKIRQGPTHSDVERVDLDWTAPTGNDRTFRIRD
jgi:acylphosphatase